MAERSKPLNAPYSGQAKRHLRKFNGVPKHHFHLFLYHRVEIDDYDAELTEVKARHAVWRVPAPVLAAGRHVVRTRRPAARHPHLGRGPDRLP